LKESRGEKSGKGTSLGKGRVAYAGGEFWRGSYLRGKEEQGKKGPGKRSGRFNGFQERPLEKKKERMKKGVEKG